MNIIPLNQKELAFVVGAAQGKTQKQIARELGVSPSRVKEHAERARLKLGAINTPQAVFNAHKAGII